MGVHMFFALLAAQAFAAQCWLFVFNLLIPCYPLDGGIITAALLQYLFDQSMSAAITISLSFLLAIGMFVLGLYLEMFSLVMVGLWCGFSGLNLFQYWSTDFLYMHPLFSHNA